MVALPLLLTRAFHAKADIPAVLSEAPPRLRIRQADVLGPSRCCWRPWNAACTRRA